MPGPAAVEVLCGEISYMSVRSRHAAAPVRADAAHEAMVGGASARAQIASSELYQKSDGRSFDAWIP